MDTMITYINDTVNTAPDIDQWLNMVDNALHFLEDENIDHPLDVFEYTGDPSEIKKALRICIALYGLNGLEDQLQHPWFAYTFNAISTLKGDMLYDTLLDLCESPGGRAWSEKFISTALLSEEDFVYAMKVPHLYHSY